MHSVTGIQVPPVLIQPKTLRFPQRSFDFKKPEQTIGGNIFKIYILILKESFDAQFKSQEDHQMQDMYDTEWVISVLFRSGL